MNIEQYLQATMKIGNYYIGKKKELVDAETIWDEIDDQGFVRNIPEDMLTLLKDENKTYNDLKLIANHYGNYLMEQK